jgi:hypothetical protein
MPQLSQRATSLGTENAFVVLAEVNALIRAGRDVISFCIGQPDFPTPVHIQDAAVAAVRGGKHGYTPSAGIDELRAAAAALRAVPCREARRLQLQEARLLPLLRCTAHGRDRRAAGRRDPARAPAAPVGAVTADGAALPAGDPSRRR